MPAESPCHRQGFLPTLSDDVVLEYFAEGNANILYTVSRAQDEVSQQFASERGSQSQRGSECSSWPSPMSAMPNAKRTMLLRLRKATSQYSPLLASEFTRAKVIAPSLPPGTILKHQPVLIPVTTIRRLNRLLLRADANGERSIKRRGTFIGSSPMCLYAKVPAVVGVFVEDMRPAMSEEALLVEIKPKWLAQSPTAPPGAIRCRTCALHALRSAQYDRSGTQSNAATEGLFCPLNLVSTRSTDLDQLARRLLEVDAALTPDHRACVHPRLVEFLMTTPLMHTLRKIQVELDPHGALAEGGSHADAGLARAMTFRDCTLFLKIPLDQTKPIIAKLGDLDLKSPAKLGHWQQIERLLIEDGCYTAQRSIGPNDITCALAP